MMPQVSSAPLQLSGFAAGDGFRTPRSSRRPDAQLLHPTDSPAGPSVSPSARNLSAGRRVRIIRHSSIATTDDVNDSESTGKEEEPASLWVDSAVAVARLSKNFDLMFDDAQTLGQQVGYP